MSENFVWHKVNEEEAQKIKEEAKKIMDDFGKSIAKVSEEGDFSVERDSFLRNEGGESLKIDRDIFFENAPRRNEKNILAEKGEWV